MCGCNAYIEKGHASTGMTIYEEVRESGWCMYESKAN
jgi:hypothetical protein